MSSDEKILPFAPKRWVELSAKGWTLAYGLTKPYRTDMEFLHYSNNRIATVDGSGTMSIDKMDYFWMVPPEQVIKFSMGLFKMGDGGYTVAIITGIGIWRASAPNFVRPLTSDEREAAEVKIP